MTWHIYLTKRPRWFYFHFKPLLKYFTCKLSFWVKVPSMSHWLFHLITYLKGVLSIWIHFLTFCEFLEKMKTRKCPITVENVISQITFVILWKNVKRMYVKSMSKAWNFKQTSKNFGPQKLVWRACLLQNQTKKSLNSSKC